MCVLDRFLPAVETPWALRDVFFLAQRMWQVFLAATSSQRTDRCASAFNHRILRKGRTAFLHLTH